VRTDPELDRGDCHLPPDGHRPPTGWVDGERETATCPAGSMGQPAWGTADGMSADDKAANKVDELAGKAKEAIGRATDNPDLVAEGKGEQARSNLKQAAEKVKDALK
jgi:uncharacterized protein YjbJ (UPF0337 family)